MIDEKLKNKSGKEQLLMELERINQERKARRDRRRGQQKLIHESSMGTEEVDQEVEEYEEEVGEEEEEYERDDEEESDGEEEEGEEEGEDN
jgi:hypothetical protein